MILFTDCTVWHNTEILTVSIGNFCPYCDDSMNPTHHLFLYDVEFAVP